ncbi:MULTISPECIES: hypothetical protein [Catenuloplanes]|uniref:Uncharacterized protein n=1 Tax=Catenuloplanes niger TaxID=587534 RepID=A0AAE4CST1_9ACTN|nr:hypothetical protein [Catenuloplanes niger]MDR7321628.1 hypothetical protein [Catenuloplanes niger]
MSILRIVRDEAAGAWRSLRYDLDRRGTEAPRFYVGYGHEPDAEDLSGYGRPPRRLLAAGAFGVLALVGAAGTYVTVANSLDSVLNTDAAARRNSPEIPGRPVPAPSPGPGLLPAAPAAPHTAQPWTTSASRPVPPPQVTTATATARGVAPVTARPGRTVEAAPTPGAPSLTGSPGWSGVTGSPGVPSLPGSPSTSGSPGAPDRPDLPVPTPTSPPDDRPPHWHGHGPDQIPDWPDWPEPPDFPTAPTEVPESMTPTPGVGDTGPGSADPIGDPPGSSGNIMNQRANVTGGGSGY